MKFKHATDEELDKMMYGSLQEGECTFKVRAASEAVSSKGNPMIKLELIVTDNAGGQAIIFDYLVEAFMYKLASFCKATFLTDSYETDSLEAYQCIEKKGKCEVKMEKDNQGIMRPKIKTYLYEEGAPFDDDIPF